MEKNIKLALGMAVGGIVLGIFSLVFALSARNTLETFHAEREGDAVVFQERWDEFSQEISRLERDLEGLSGTSASSSDQFNELIEQTQEAFDSFGAQIRSLSDDISRVAATTGVLDDRIGDLEESIPLPVEAPAPAAPAPQPGEEIELAESVEPGEPGERFYYQVQSGDTLSGIARRFEVPLRDLEEHNPGIDPLRLQLGQEIVIHPGE